MTSYPPDRADNARVVVGGGAQVVVRIAGLASVLVTAPLLVRHLGAAAYGRFAVALAVAFLIATVADLGLPLVAMRDWPGLDAADRGDWLPRFWSLRVWSGLSVAVLALSAVMALPLDSEMRLALIVALIGVPATLASNALGALFLSRLDPWPSVWSEVVSRLVWIGGLVVAISLSASLVVTLAVMVFSQSAGLVAMVLPAVRQGILSAPRPALLGATRQLARKAAPLALLPVLGVIYARADTLVMVSLTTDAETGVYGALWRLVEVLVSVGVIGAGLLLPLLSRTHDEEARRVHYVRATRLLMTFLIPATVLVAVLGDDILRWFGGTGFFVPVDTAWGQAMPSSALVVLMAATVLMGFGVVHASVMVATHRQRALLRQSILVIGVNLALAMFLIGRVSFVGAAWAVLLTELVSITHSTLVIRGAIGRFRFADILAWPVAIGGGVLAVTWVAAAGPPLVRLVLGGSVAAVGFLASPAMADVVEVLRARRSVEAAS